MTLHRLLPAVAVFVVSGTVAPAIAHADAFLVSTLNAGVQSSASSNFVEGFDTQGTGTMGLLTTTFNHSGLTGTYSGVFQISPATQFGGANGSNYITTSSTYTLTLSDTVNYFGMWFSALDNGNQLTFFLGTTAVYSFSPSNYAALVGTCSSANGYCGNPNSQFAGQDASQQFAFLNFYDSNGGFNKVVFTESPQVGGFESDNHTVAQLNAAPVGVVLSPVPEPSSLALLGLGSTGTIGLVRRRVRRG